MKDNNIYKRVYFHAVRRAMQENEILMQRFMDSTAVNYDTPRLEQLDAILVSIPDNDLFDLLMGHKFPADLKDGYDEGILTDIVNGVKIHMG